MSRERYFAAEEVVKRIRSHVLTWDHGGTGSRATEGRLGFGDDNSRIDVEFADGSAYEIIVRTIRLAGPVSERPTQ